MTRIIRKVFLSKIWPNWEELNKTKAFQENLLWKPAKLVRFSIIRTENLVQSLWNFPYSRTVNNFEAFVLVFYENFNLKSAQISLLLSHHNTRQSLNGFYEFSLELLFSPSGFLCVDTEDKKSAQLYGSLQHSCSLSGIYSHAFNKNFILFPRMRRRSLSIWNKRSERRKSEVKNEGRQVSMEATSLFTHHILELICISRTKIRHISQFRC